jgi:cell division protein FtsA
VHSDLARNGSADELRGGVVLTGGGAQLDGLLELSEQVFNTSVRYGLPQGLGGLVDVISSPIWSTASGLLLYGKATEADRAKKANRRSSAVRSVVGSLREMFSDLL